MVAQILAKQTKGNVGVTGHDRYRGIWDQKMASEWRTETSELMSRHHPHPPPRVHTHTCTQLHTRTHVCVHIHTCTHTHRYTHAHRSKHTHTQAEPHTHTRSYTHTHTCIHVAPCPSSITISHVQHDASVTPCTYQYNSRTPDALG